MTLLRFEPSAIERWPIERLLPYAGNSRVHSDDQIAKLAASLAQFGWTVPVLVDDRGVLIAGHGRLLAARRLGLSEVPVIRLGHLSDVEARAYRIADNKLTEIAGWDEEMLAAELDRLKEDGFDLGLTGFDDAEIGRLLDLGEEAAIEGEDQVPEPPAEPITRPGDLWLLGKHRLLCGDATAATDVERLLDGARPLLMVTDPPYGTTGQPLAATADPLVWQLAKQYASGPSADQHTITKPVAGTVVVRVNGNAVAVTVDHLTGRVTFGAAPGAQPYADFQFDVPVRFDADHLPVVAVAYHIQQVSSITLIEIRA
jgi:ParB-like chromosome segregation protein Spo0J